MTRSLPLKFGLAIAAVALPPLVMLGGLFYIQTTRQVERSREVAFAQIASDVERRLDHLQRDAIAQLESLAVDPVIWSRDASDLRRAEKMRAVRDLFHAYNEISLVTSDGRAIATTAKAPSAADWRDSRILKEVIAGRAALAMEPPSADSDERLLVAAAPVRGDDGEVWAVLIGELDMECVASMIDAPLIGATGFAVLLDSRGRIIAGADGAPIEEEWPTSGESTHFADGQSAFFKFTSRDGVSRFCYVTGTRDHGLNEPCSWRVAVVQDVAEAERPVRHAVVHLALVLAAAVVFVFMMTSWLSRGITKPIRRLSAASRAVAEGDWTARATVYDEDEIGELAETFNAMIEHLHEAVEERVALAKEKEAAVMANDLKDQFLTTISQEIRTPLNAIVGLGDLLLLDPTPAPAHWRERVRTISNESGRLLRLINDLLDNARINAGTLTLVDGPFNPREVLESVVGETESAAKSRGVQVSLDVGREVPRLLNGDEIRLRQVLANLMTGAVHAISGGRVSISAHSHDFRKENATRVRFIIRENSSSAIESFVSESEYGECDCLAATSETLALHVARQIVRLMGGSFAFEGSFGENAVITIDLAFKKCTPAEEQRHDREAEEMESTSFDASALIGCTVLVAEDDPVGRMTLSEQLTYQGAAVVAVEDGAEAVQACTTQAFDVILMDLQMPRMDGFAAAVAIRNASNPSHKSPILALTVHDEAETRERCLAVGMTDVLLKPAKVVDLRRAILRAVVSQGADEPEAAAQSE